MTYRCYFASIACGLIATSVSAFAQVSISVNVAPPPLVVEEQPPIPDDGYIWTPGYWAYDEDQDAYYWVEGAWVQPPETGLYWTPSYWGWDNATYVYYPGYWGPTVGFYGGVNYGYGYWGNGYGGGRWDNGHFNYNTAANNVSGGRVHNTYADRTAYRAQSRRVSYNGGKGGVQARPTAAQQQAAQQSHVQATPQQQTHFQSAAQTRSHMVKANAKKSGTANASSTATANQPGAGSNPAGAASSAGQSAAEQRREVPPVQMESHASPEVSPKPEEKPREVNAENPEAKRVQQPAPAETRAEERPAAPVIERTTPPVESHAAQAPGGETKREVPAAGAESHPQAQPHPAAAAQAPAPAKPEGQGGSQH